LQIAGGQATGFDVLPAPGEAFAQAPPLIESSDIPWYLHRGDTARVWILEGQDEAVAVATSTGSQDFRAWADQLDEAVQSLEWGATP
jgi:hypothetical protein